LSKELLRERDVSGASIIKIQFSNAFGGGTATRRSAPFLQRGAQSYTRAASPLRNSTSAERRFAAKKTNLNNQLKRFKRYSRFHTPQTNFYIVAINYYTTKAFILSSTNSNIFI
jgi:hypothetical protein